MHEFRYTSFAQDVIFGAGSGARLGEAADRSGWNRLLLCTSGSSTIAACTDFRSGSR